jgi:hypothetical protein
VDRLGDTAFLKETTLNSGALMLTGPIKLKDGRVFNVKYLESPKKGEAWLYVFVQTELTMEQLEGGTDSALMCLAQDVYNHISKHHGWRFGLMESHKGSKTHYVPNSSMTDELVQVLPTGESIKAGELWTDNSPPRQDGKPTLETTSKATAIGLMTSIPNLIESVQDMKIAIQLIHNNQTILISDQQVLSSILNSVVVNQNMLMQLLGITKEQSKTEPEREADRQPQPGSGEEVA